MSCKYINAFKNAESCKITMAGTGDRVYFFDKDEWTTAISNAIKGGADAPESVEEGSITTEGLPEPGYKGFYGLKDDGTDDEEVIAKLNLLNGKDVTLWAVDIKTDSGQVTSEKSDTNEASSQVGTFVVADNIENFNELAHTLAFVDYGCLIPRVGGGFYVVMSPYKKPTLSNNYDSGTTYDSDHGFTATVTASPCEYGVTFMPDGVHTQAKTTITKGTIDKDNADAKEESTSCVVTVK